jgi:hypothetical protein
MKKPFGSAVAAVYLDARQGQPHSGFPHGSLGCPISVAVREC